MLVIEHVVQGLSDFLYGGQQLLRLNKEPLSAAVFRITFHNAAILKVAMARILKVLVE